MKMMSQKRNGEKLQEMVVVAIDRDKWSQGALKWAVDNLLSKGKCVTLLHVKPKDYSTLGGHISFSDNEDREFFLPFRCFCTRKDIQVIEVLIEGSDIAQAICDYVKNNLIETVVIGSSPKNGLVRLKTVDIPGNVTRMAPDFCSIYVTSKGKLVSCKSSSHSVQKDPSSLQNSSNYYSGLTGAHFGQSNGLGGGPTFSTKSLLMEELDAIRSPFARGNTSQWCGQLLPIESDISFVCSPRPNNDRIMSPLYQDPARLSTVSDSENRLSFGSPFLNVRQSDANNCFGVYSKEIENVSWLGSKSLEEVEAEMKRLKQELKQTMDMYSNACKEALTSKQKTIELNRWKVEEQHRAEDARQAEEAALALVELEREKCRVALEKAEAAQRIAEVEARKRMEAERKALKEADEKNKVLDRLARNDVRYRKYSIEEIEIATEHFAVSRKIGEGGYGPVYKCYLDHTPVAIKVLRPGAAEGRKQFHQEIEVLSCIRHPNMVLLLGACPEYGCLVYEHMSNGSLEDCLSRRGNAPTLPWQLRFRIAAEIATGLLFLHQTKPEPLVHRDLKPGNILLDHNFVSKISDVGLARLVPPSVADTVTRYHMTSAAGTFCYIDPEYQQTGLLGTKSDVYSLGVMLLQIVTAKPPMGLAHHVEKSIKNGTFPQMLDPYVHDWPVEEALVFAKLALMCTEMKRKDRPDLGTVVVPELNRLRAFAEESVPTCSLVSSPRKPTNYCSSRSHVIESQKLHLSRKGAKGHSVAGYIPE